MTQDGELHDLVNAAETALSRGNIDQAKRDLLLARERLKDQNSPGQLRGRGQPEDDDQESMISVLQDLETAIHEADELRSQKKKRQPAEKKASRNGLKAISQGSNCIVRGARLTSLRLPQLPRASRIWKHFTRQCNRGYSCCAHVMVRCFVQAL